MAYSLVFVITADMKWNAVKGDSSRYLGMTMLPEALIVVLCVWTIWGVPALESVRAKERDPENDSGSQDVPLVK